MSIKTRIFKDKNYKGIYFNGKTLRIALNPKKPIEELDYPEFYDIKITGNCGGNCPYCYMDSKSSDDHYDIGKLRRFFESLDDNQKPFQIAYGGGEPTSHPLFWEIMWMTREQGITPNYTTNGMWSFEKERIGDILSATKNYCEGVAVSCHPHLEMYWKKATELLLNENIFTNFHLMISDKKSVDYFLKVYNSYKDKIKYFVLLPLVDQGRCVNADSDFDYLFDKIKLLGDISKIAFGAKFYERLQTENLDVSLYEPEIMSKYIDLKDGKVYNSSFDTRKSIRSIT